MSPTDPRQDVHAFLSRELTQGMLLSAVKRWHRTFPAWSWHYEQDALLPGDWVLDLGTPTGQTYSFFLHPVGTQLRLTSPHALALSVCDERDRRTVRRAPAPCPERESAKQGPHSPRLHTLSTKGEEQ